MKSLKALLKQKTGMTFVEILVAMSVLMLVIVSFTPMLLHAYDSLYTAGEINEKTYDAKSTVEEGLATRSSTDILYNIQTNFKNIGKVADVNLRRAVSATGSDLRDGIESLFYGGKGTLKIISGKRVNDDKIDKTILIKTSGIVIDKVVAGKASDAKMTKNGKEFKYTIAVSVIAPDWSKTSETEAYNLSAPLTNITCSFDKQGLITVKIPNQDLTSSPLKIIVYYYDETTKLNNTGTAPASGEEPREATTFLYIDPPTLLLAGKTESTGTYYTSAGIEIANNGDTSMTVDKRVMTAAGNFSVPGVGSTVIKNVTWVDNDTTNDYGNYYVLTGTNGAIMRLYPSLTTSGLTNIRSLTATTETKQPVPIKDGGLTKTVYPAIWGGDTTEQFGYSTFWKSMGYRHPSVKHWGSSCWYTQEGVSNKTSIKYTQYSTQAKYAYVYNGYKTAYDYSQQNGRKISYCLTETVAALRFVGSMQSDFDGYNAIWENNTKWLGTSITNSKDDVHQTKSVTFRVKTDDSGAISDKNFGYINIKAINSLSPSYLFDTEKYPEVTESNWSTKINKYIDTADEAKTSLTITDAVYDAGMGGMYYVGNAKGYAFIRQNDLLSTGEAERVTMHGSVFESLFKTYSKNIPSGTATAYYVASDGYNGTTVKKMSRDDDAIGPLQTTMQSNSGQTTTTQEKNSFYFTRGTGLSQAYFDDFKFTFGYASNRFKTYSEITVIDGKEQYRSYEKYYFLSHYGNANHEPAWFAYNSTFVSSLGYDASVKNTYNDDYYNIWFPGEMYNLDKIVNKEGITVGVGYAVSGSTFQWVNPNKTANSSTAVGGFFNDGVLAVKLEDDEYFTNKLYFKDNDTFDGSSLSNTTEYKNVFGTYGTHSRDSVQFTAVDIQVLATGDKSRNVKSFYAIYGDNKGRVFKSLVATTYSTGSEADSSTSTVDFIADLSYAGSTTPPSRMEEITINGASLSTYFKSISTIVCDDTTVIISGVPRSSTFGNTVVVGVAVLNADETTTTWRWGHVELASSSYATNVSKIVDGNYYAAGTYNTSKGFLLGIPLETIKAAVQDGTVDLRSRVLVDNTHITTPIYAMDGRGANG